MTESANVVMNAGRGSVDSGQALLGSMTVNVTAPAAGGGGLRNR
jgi:hypothetical protein